MNPPTKGMSRGKEDRPRRVRRVAPNRRIHRPEPFAPLWEREILDRLVQGLVEVPAFLTDAQGIVTSLSPSLAELLEYPAAEIVGRSAREFWIGRDDDGLKIIKELAIRDRVVGVEVSILARSGREIPCRVTAAVVKDSRGRVAGIVGSLGEIVGKKNSRDGGERANKEAASTAYRAASAPPITFGMAALIAHEVRNPLASMYLNVEMLREHIEHIADEAIRGEAYELIESALGEVDRLRDITREHLDRASASHRRFRMQSLGEALLELQRFMQQEMEWRRVEFANTFSPGMPDLYFDRERLKEAIMNLYKNSADAMPEGGRISTVTRVVDGWAEILVCDTGPGISAAAAAALFRPFFTTKKSGTGLGLSIVTEILEEHRGGIEVRREPGEGAFFAVRLPLQA